MPLLLMWQRDHEHFALRVLLRHSKQLGVDASAAKRYAGLVLVGALPPPTFRLLRSGLHSGRPRSVRVYSDNKTLDSRKAMKDKSTQSVGTFLNT